MLTDTQIKQAKRGERERKLSDGQGLYLLVTPTGGKLWRWKYYFNGTEKKMALGQYPAVSLAEARKRRNEAAELLSKRIDPMRQRKAEKKDRIREGENSFTAVAKAWHAHWKSDKDTTHAEKLWQRMEADLLSTSALGRMLIDQITTRDIVELVKQIEERAPETARKTLGTISQVFRYGMAHGLAKANPIAGIKPSDLLKARQRKHHARVETQELPELLTKIETYRGTLLTRTAALLLAHTAVRTQELTNATWDEFDFEKKRWQIPAERMKMRTPHIVPLTSQTIKLLDQLHALTGEGHLLFPNERDRSQPMAPNTVLRMLQRLGYKDRQTGHGFRGIASTYLHEEWPSTHPLKSEIINLQLAHTRRNQVSAAYDHSKHLDVRTEMMTHWSNYLDKARQKTHKLAIVSGRAR